MASTMQMSRSCLLRTVPLSRAISSPLFHNNLTARPQHVLATISPGRSLPHPNHPQQRQQRRCYADSSSSGGGESWPISKRRAKKAMREALDRPPLEADIAYEPVQPHAVVADLTKRMKEEEREELDQVQMGLQGQSLAADVKNMAEEMEAMYDAGETSDKVFDFLADDDKPDFRSFWYDEDDPETVTETQDEADDDVDMPESAHEKLEELREIRQYMRVIAWEMPLLAQYARPFEPPSPEHVLRFRYTSYMGDRHPSEAKVVVQFAPDDLPDMTPVQREKLKKLAGPRYNPEKEIVHMSCESYENQAQNKRYLSDLVDKMIAMAKDPTDTFEDIPLDLRHHPIRVKPKFPVEWRMNPERRAELDKIHAETAKRDEDRRKAGKLVDGQARANMALGMDVETKAHVDELLAGKVYTRLPLATRR